jgi:hypothetical protein
MHIVVVNSGAEAASITNEGLSADNTIRTDVETQRAAVALLSPSPRYSHPVRRGLATAIVGGAL